MSENLDAKIEALLRSRRFETASADLKQRIVRQAHSLQGTETVGAFNGFRDMTQRGWIWNRGKKR